MTKRRAQEVALAIIVNCEAKRRTLTINPHENEWRLKCRKMNLDQKKVHQFILEVWLPIVSKEAWGVDVKAKVTNDTELAEGEKGTIAFKLLEYRGMSIDKHFDARVVTTSKETGISQDEIREFFISFLINPHLKGLKLQPVAS